MKQYNEYFEANRRLWDQKTPVHKNSSFYDLESFRKGKSSLNQIELEDLGNVKGKKILHLQCHFGMDSLSFARMGAAVTGVDFSAEAIKTAMELNEELSLDARFICCNIYDLPLHLDEKFDIVFTSYGVIGWLPDLQKWAALISAYLAPGGLFYMAEFHPVVWMLDEQLQEVKYYYNNVEMIEVELEGTYADRSAPIKSKEYSWNHGLGEVINSLIAIDLTIEHLQEFTYSPYNCFQNLVKGDDGNYRIAGREDKVPMVYSLKARRS